MNVLDALDIRSKSGDEWLAVCPFHDDSTPSMSVNIRKGVYVCYACGAKGRIERMARHLGADWTPRTALDTLVEDLERLFSPPPPLPDERELLRYNMPTNYWTDERHFLSSTVRAWELGYDPIMRAGTIPVRNFSGVYLGIILRHVDPNVRPKYLYQRGFSKSEHLFGAHKAKYHNSIVVVEGALDAIALWDVGAPAVALMGSQVSETQKMLLRTLGPTYVLIATDADEAGRIAGKAVQESLPGEVKVGWYRYPQGVKDPGELPADKRRDFLRLLQTESIASPLSSSSSVSRPSARLG